MFLFFCWGGGGSKVVRVNIGVPVLGPYKGSCCFGSIPGAPDLLKLRIMIPNTESHRCAACGYFGPQECKGSYLEARRA